MVVCLLGRGLGEALCRRGWEVEDPEQLPYSTVGGILRSKRMGITSSCTPCPCALGTRLETYHHRCDLLLLLRGVDLHQSQPFLFAGNTLLDDGEHFFKPSELVLHGILTTAVTQLHGTLGYFT